MLLYSEGIAISDKNEIRLIVLLTCVRHDHTGPGMTLQLKKKYN